jgi:DNA repair protein RadC
VTAVFGGSPRTRLSRLGPEALTDTELVAVLLKTGTPGQSATQLADAMINRAGGIAQLLGGDGSGTGEQPLRPELRVVLELAKRVTSQQLQERDVFGSPDAVKNFLQLHLARQPYEVFALLFLDAQNRLICMEEMFRGTLTQTSVYPREVVARSLQLHAAAVVLAHNHPSGTVQPSRADEALTQTIKAALALVDIRVLDHVIVAPGAALSMAEKGLV